MKIILSKYWPEIILGVLVVGFVLACLNQSTNNESLAAASGLNTGQWLYVIASVALTGLFCYWIFGGNSSPISQKIKTFHQLIEQDSSSSADESQPFSVESSRDDDRDDGAGDSPSENIEGNDVNQPASDETESGSPASDPNGSKPQSGDNATQG